MLRGADIWDADGVTLALTPDYVEFLPKDQWTV